MVDERQRQQHPWSPFPWIGALTLNGVGSQVEKANTEILFDQRRFPDRFHQRNQELFKNRIGGFSIQGNSDHPA